MTKPRIATGLALSVALGIASTAQAQTATSERIVVDADRALEKIGTLRAQFTQRVENPVLERTTVGRGVLVYDSSGRFRIAYTDPAGDLVVNDGRHLWIYLPSSQPGQVIRQPAADGGVRNPLTFLRDLRAMYRVVSVESVPLAGRTTRRLGLLPESERAPYAELVVWVDAQDKLPRQVRTRTMQDVVTTYTFEALGIDAPISASEFTFKAPSGVEIYDQ